MEIQHFEDEDEDEDEDDWDKTFKNPHRTAIGPRVYG
jgi:hypothetical protein